MTKKDANLIDKARADKFRKIGRMIVATEQRVEGTVRDSLIACKGFTPEQCEQVKDGIKAAYATLTNELYEKAEHDLPDNFTNLRQAIRNRKSEKLAVLDCFRLYAGFTAKERGLFDAQCDAAGSYHALVSVCRSVVAVSSGEKLADKRSNKAKSTSVSSRGFKVTLERVERMTKEQLTTLSMRIQAALKKYDAAPANVHSINKARAKKIRAAELVTMKKPAKKARKAA